MKAKASRIMDRINELAAISEDEGCLTRRFGTPAFVEGSIMISSWMKSAGLAVRTDNIGNVRGRWESSKPDAKTLVIGSHMDTVANAGKFDGPLGVIMAIEIIETLIQTGETFPFHIECIAFSDEEGVRFHTTFLGSKVVAGSFHSELLQKNDSEGTRLEEVLHKINCDPGKITGDALAREDWLGYFEIHIEQGPVLYKHKTPVAIVSGIAAQKRVRFTCNGMAGHAGTVPMDMRRDALCCAAECILAIEKLAEKTSNLVATVGMIEVENGASNVIPGKVSGTLDIRSIDPEILDSASAKLFDTCREISNKRDIELTWSVIQETSPVICDSQMNALLKSAIESKGYEAIELVSGAGHDAVEISSVATVAMLFVKCFEGISHNPLENVEMNDIASAMGVAINFMERFATSINKKV